MAMRCHLKILKLESYKMIKRRKFIQKSALAFTGLTFVNSVSAKSYRNIIGSNDRIKIAFQGLGRRISGLLNGVVAQKNIEVTHLCDVMDKQIMNASKRFYELTGNSVKSEKNIHKIFDDKDVDAIIMATPDHWHAYGACKGMESGKHIYLEKPCSHNMKESELLLSYQKYFKKVVQMGNQQRSSPHTKELIKKIKEGVLGKTYKATAFYHSNRPRVPNQVLASVPKGLNWNLFQGPAVRRNYTYDTWDYNWRWYGWDYGTGEAGNNATHELDIARWALNVDYPIHANVYAGKHHYVDDGWTMYDTMHAIFKFDKGKTIIWDGQSRNAFEKSKEGGRGTKIWGSKGSAFVNRAGYQIYNLKDDLIFDSLSKENINRYSSGGNIGNMTQRHLKNFFECIRSGEDLTSPISDAVISQSLVHYANVSYRSNQSFSIDSKSSRIKNKKAMKFWSRDYEKGWEIKDPN